jgi:hypothetical protein
MGAKLRVINAIIAVTPMKSNTKLKNIDVPLKMMAGFF